MNETRRHITALLKRIEEGDDSAGPLLYDIVYGELLAIATHALRSASPRDALDPVALVSEGYLKLLDQHARGFSCRGHFFATAAKAMRWILVDQARARASAKRKARGDRQSLSELAITVDRHRTTVLDLDAALTDLSCNDQRTALICELRLFGGLSPSEISKHLRLALRTTEREWQLGRAWLADRLQ